MNMQKKTTVNLFDKYSLVIPSDLEWRMESHDGNRCLFITDKEETFTVSFEEGMNQFDMQPSKTSTVNYQLCRDYKYIHLSRNCQGMVTHAFFHFEVEDENFVTFNLPGKMIVSSSYRWSDGIEPVLMQLMEGLAVLELKDGDSS